MKEIRYDFEMVITAVMDASKDEVAAQTLSKIKGEIEGGHHVFVTYPKPHEGEWHLGLDKERCIVWTCVVA